MSVPRHLVYVGTYTRAGRSEGIHVFRHDPATGAFEHLSTTPEVDPSWLEFHPSRDYLFTVSEGFGRNGGAVASYAIASGTGELTWLSRQPTRGGEPCHLCVDPSGRYVLVANHEHGSVAVFPVDSDGRLQPLSDLREHSGSGPGQTQQGPHAHHVTFDPAGRRVLVTDKGIDQVVVYTLDTASGKLVPNEPPFGTVHAGAAPRHLTFGSDGRFAYVNGEADMTLSVFSYDAATGALQELQTLPTLPEGHPIGPHDSTAELVVDPSGRFAYVSNRGHDSIACYAIDQPTGRLRSIGTVATRGRTPRNFAIEPSGKRLYAANQGSDTIVEFSLDADTGNLTPTGQTVEVGAPVCVLFS